MKKIGQFGKDDVEIVNDKLVYDNFFKIHNVSLRHKLFKGGWSDVFERELCVRHDAVGILLYDPKTQNLAMIEQIRVGAINRSHSPWLLEVVAGMIDDPTESKSAVAIRETQEEAGLEVEAIEPMLEYFATPGGSSEFFSLFVGRVSLENISEGVFGLDIENEDIRLHIISVNETLDLLRAGKINNAMTIIALQWLALNKSSLDKKWLAVDAKP